ncbi:universal stress protein [Paucibacter sediminis]|uniref:Universal stress protein n=1 Tax=Paucibacter sediminis TaxID=3019553 RepID=A0AA95NCC1_9BURK|nr:universal stress protein [Paucibacter sp. S2-9]WIT12540.1 universal stress protein [Paucibacter sp. S2-9]
MFKRILLPTDGSEHAARAAAVACDLAKRYGAALEIVSVIDPVPFVSFPEGGGEALAYYLDAAEEGAKQGIAAAEAAAKAAGVAWASHVLREHGPAQSIVEHAKAYGADLIVMGSHGRRGLDAVLLGSVAHKVLTLAKVPVFVVK